MTGMTNLTTWTKTRWHLGLVRMFGIGHAVRYLRNPDPRVTVPLLRACGANIGEWVTVKRSLFLDNVYEDTDSQEDFSNIVIGDGCYIGDLVYLDLANRVEFGKQAVVSAHAAFVTHADCNRSPELACLFPRICKEIVIGPGAWIGHGATVLNGVTIGEQSVVAAGSLVTQDTRPHSLYGGIPARRLRGLGELTNGQS